MAFPMVPENDDAFDTRADQFFTAVNANPAGYGLTAADITALTAARTAWKASHPAQVAAQLAAETATTKKNGDKTAFGNLVRGGMKKVKGTVGISPALLTGAGMRVPVAAKTSLDAPSTRPLAHLDLKPNSTIVLHVVDEATPKRTAKPVNAHGWEIWTAVGAAPPASPAGYAFLTLATRTPYTDVHPVADAGKNVYYLLRWQNHKGQTGPWSDVVTTKVPG